MRRERRVRSNAEKLAVFRECFTGLMHAYGTYDARTGQAYQVKRPVTDETLLSHLTGRRPYGVYLLVHDHTRAVVADFDKEDSHPPLRFIRRASHYGLRAYLERSKRKGWHVWIFTELPGVTAAKARLVVKAILDDIDAPDTEVFPKHDRLSEGTRYGAFINAPLFGRLFARGRTLFVNPEQGLTPYEDQWDVLMNVRRASEAQLDEIIEVNQFQHTVRPRRNQTALASATGARSSFGLPPGAQRMLAEGVTRYQRVACFRLALHLKRAGIPQDVAVAALAAWAAKNRPADGKEVITESELIEQTACAYTKSYRSCGCEDPAVTPFCDADCPLQRTLRTRTAPSAREYRPSVADDGTAERGKARSPE